MPTDIYIKRPTEEQYDVKRMEVDLEVDQFLQAIDMLLNTTKGTVLGYPEMGCNLDAYLWNPYVTSGEIISEIKDQIQRYVPEYASTIPYDIKVEFIKGDIIDGIYINIIIDTQQVFGVIVK